MTDLRTAAQMALDALESSRVFVMSREKIKHPEGTEWYDERIEALRAALEQGEPEPVAWMCPDDPERETAFNWKAGHCEGCGKQRAPVYTAPRQREWQGLTDEEVGLVSDEFLEGVLWAEAKLKEKNI